jgi:hypothetical protein
MQHKCPIDILHPGIHFFATFAFGYSLTRDYGVSLLYQEEIFRERRNYRNQFISLGRTRSMHLSQYSKRNPIQSRIVKYCMRAYLYMRYFPENIQEYPLDAHGVRV